ncbi:MAG: hypothetical protein JW757_07050, partial [Anaerolineales bacterium]|nr:hypothetical protein [Anaerolineales bacterium]
MKTKFHVIVALFVIFAVLLTACGGNEATPVVENTTENNTSAANNSTGEAAEEPANQPAEEPMEEEMMAYDVAFYLDPLAQAGDVISAGSSTVFPLASKMAERLT